MEELRARKNVVVQRKERDDMFSETTETRVEKGKRDTRREPSSSTGPSEPVRAPFLNDGIEQVRDSHC
jgi:hypothetical protein